MIYTKNQWVCKFDIADYRDFIGQDDLIEMLYVESAAMTLPTIRIKFIIRDTKVLEYLNQGSVLSIGFGRDAISMISMNFRIITENTKKRPSVGQLLVIEGIHSDSVFINDKETVTYKNLTSLDVVSQEVKKYFPIFKTNIEKTNDRQSWHKHETGWEFLKRVCAQGFIDENTFVVSAFNHNTFMYYDYRRLLLDAAKNINNIPTFSKNKASSDTGNIIMYNNSHSTCDSGITSQILGNQQLTVEYDWENYTIKCFSENLLGFTSADTKNLPLLYTDSLSNVYTELFSNESTSHNYANIQNSKNLILLGNVRTFITIGGQFKKLNLLDVVLIDETGDARIRGLSIVSGIAYQIVNNNLYTNVTLSRESFNAIQGEDLIGGL